MPRFPGKRLAWLAISLSLLVVGSAWAAFQGLPSNGTQVNSDATAGINPSDPVDLSDPTNADVVGGALTAGGPAVPWAIFRQNPSGPDQIFVRSFAAGAWKTRGIGTVGGKSNGSPSSASLNFDQGQDGEVPAIDFAGAGRTVPWATWYEDVSAFGSHKNIFASRFDNIGDVNQDKWIFGGQSRGAGTGSVPVPSLNIHTDRDAENPSVAGGSAIDPTKPGPWVTWQEIGAGAPGTGKNQIFVVKPIGPGTTVCPAGTKPAPANPAAAPLGGFCWQQVGVERLGADPSLNVDRTRDGIEPDVAFTGTNDSVPWVVWYEQNNSAVSGLHSNEMVFAAKGVAPSTTPPPTGTVDGGFNWVAVGRTGQGVLDASAGGGLCGASASAEAGCSLNNDPNQDAEDIRVTSGTMTAGTPTSPWVVWDEGSQSAPGNNSVFVAHLVGSQFVIANNGLPIGTGDRADITFSGNTPYVSWHNNNQVVFGHFATPNLFLKDNAPVGTNASDAVRAPISSACTANPFNGDGAACQGGAVGTPFFLFSDGTPGNAKLFSDAYQSDPPVAGTPSAVTTTGATLNATVNPQGGPVSVSFEFGPSTAYGQATAPQTIKPTDTATAFTAAIGGLAPATTIHYRAVARTDFGTVLGADQTLRTATPPDRTPPRVTLSITKKSVKRKHGHIKVQLKLKISVNEASTASIKGTTVTFSKHKHHTVTPFSTHASFSGAGSKTMTLTPSGNGAKILAALLRAHKKVKITITATVTDRAHNKTRKTTHVTLK